MQNHLILNLLCVLWLSNSSAQESETYVWHDPLEILNKIDGQGWSNMSYNRFPDTAENLVRKPVWGLSRHAAGLSIRFISDADNIQIKYEVNGNIAMNHMPATGVSGVDLYGKSAKGKWLWYRGLHAFGDTITSKYKTQNNQKTNREYQLYLPLYNNCKKLKVGIPKESGITFLPQREEKPIVVYGTSIAQGACASRPGMAWTNILGRTLDYPIVNLGFSGNGRLEPEVLALVTDIAADIYVLDCLPNLSPNKTNTETEIKKRLRNSIQYIRKKRPEAKILLTQHAGYGDGEVDTDRKNVYETLNRWTTEVFEEQQRNSHRNLYMLTKEEINLSNDAFVDGTHPTDLGMEHYAKAYEKTILPLLAKE